MADTFIWTEPNVVRRFDDFYAECDPYMSLELYRSTTTRIYTAMYVLCAADYFYALHCPKGSQDENSETPAPGLYCCCK